MIADKDLLSIQQARILAENAFEAQKRLAAFTQEALDAILEGVAKEVVRHVGDLAVMSHEETDYGNWQDKLAKNRFVCAEVVRHMRGMRCVGVIGEDTHGQVVDIGVPMGVVVALSPVTSPVSSTICTTFLAIKSGNALIFSPHPRAIKSISRVLDIMICAAESLGLPQGCLSYLDTVTKSGTRELMNHAATSLLMVTGVPGMLHEARCSGKPVIYGGAGNGPAFVERSADIARAAKDIVRSKTFDNGVAPSAEQCIVADARISKDLKLALQENDAYFMSDEESLRLAALYFHPNGRCNKSMVGQPAGVLAKRAGIAVPGNVTVLIAQRKYVSADDPYSRGFLSPVLAYYVEDDWEHACEKCIELLLHERNAHTLAIYSNNDYVIRQFALKKPVGRLLVNTPAALGGIGATTNLFPAMTLGSGSAGHGITSDNVSPMNLIYTRKVGYGVRQVSGLSADAFAAGVASLPEGGLCAENSAEMVGALHKILTEAIEVMDASSGRQS